MGICYMYIGEMRCPRYNIVAYKLLLQRSRRVCRSVMRRSNNYYLGEQIIIYYTNNGPCPGLLQMEKRSIRRNWDYLLTDFHYSCSAKKDLFHDNNIIFLVGYAFSNHRFCALAHEISVIRKITSDQKKIYNYNEKKK